MRLTAEIVDLELHHPFTIARGTQDVSQTVIARLQHGDYVGIGEACPSDFYGETPESVVEALSELAPWIEKGSPVEFRGLLEAAAEEFGPTRRAALSALDLAVHDWFGKRIGHPLYRLWGLDLRDTPPTSFTIGIDTTETMVAKIREASDAQVIKIKLGTDRDLEIVRALRAETEARLRVDANCAWSVSETVEKSVELKALGVEFIEQPLPPDELDAMEEVYAKSALPLIADENCIVAEDVPSLRGRFHGVNIKLIKCGGLLPALNIVSVARSLGMQLMIGCMVDSSVSATAAAHLGPLVDYLDLDGPLLIKNDPYHGLEYIKGRPIPLNRPGIGVEPR